MPSPRLPASRSIRPQAKPPCGRFQRASPAGPAPPGGLRPPPSPPANFPAPDGPKPSACRLISLLASRRNQSPLCVKGGGAKRRRDRFGTGCNYFKMTGRSQLLLPKGASGSLREPFRICHNRLFQYAKTPGHWTGGLLALWLPCGEGQGGRS